MYRLLMAMITIFKPAISPYTSPLYAVAQGFFLGGVSALFENMYPGVVVPAIALTFGTLAAMLTAYATRLVKATENFKLGVVAATGGIAIFYLATMVMGFFGITIFSSFFQSGWIGIGFSLVVVVIAARSASGVSSSRRATSKRPARSQVSRASRESANSITCS